MSIVRRMAFPDEAMSDVAVPGIQAQVCLECGFDLGTLSPGDAVAAVGRATSAFGQLLDSDQARTAGSDESGWTPVSRALHAADAVTGCARALRRLRTEPEPHLEEFGEPWRDRDVELSREDMLAHGDAPFGVALARLDGAAQLLADAAARMPDGHWAAVAIVDGHRVTGLDLVRWAAHEGAHHARMLANQILLQRR